MGLRKPIVFQAAQMGPDPMKQIAKMLSEKAPSRGRQGMVDKPLWGRNQQMQNLQMPPVLPPMAPVPETTPVPPLGGGGLL